MNFRNQLLKILKRKVYSSFKDNICGSNLRDIYLTSKFNKGVMFLLCVVDILSKFAWAFFLKMHKVGLLLMDFKRC